MIQSIRYFRNGIRDLSLYLRTKGTRTEGIGEDTIMAIDDTNLSANTALKDTRSENL